MPTERGGAGAIISIAASLVILLLVLLIGLHYENVVGTTSKPGIASHSKSEEQLQLCVEGKPSVYGNPPSAEQQSICDRYLAGQAGGVGGVPPVPATTAPTTAGGSHNFTATQTLSAAENEGPTAPSVPGVGPSATTTTLPPTYP